MTRRTIRETLQGDWTTGLDGLTITQAVEWLNFFPPNATLDLNWTGYEDVQGDIDILREESDEEYAYRLLCEKEGLEAAQKKAAQKALDDKKNIDDAVARLELQISELKRVRPK